MFRKKSSIWLVVLLALISLGLACGGQTDEANKLINEANASIDKSRATDTKITSLTNELLGENWTKAEDNEKYKADHKAKFDELISLNDQNEKMMSEASAKFDQASKMKLEDKFKEYVSFKAQEFKKRAEIYKADGAFVKAFLAEKDAEKANTLIVDSNKKSADMLKEATDLDAKAEKIIKDNPSIFKKS